MPRYHARTKFDRINELNKTSDAGGEFGINARAAKKASNQRWERRDMRPGTMYKTKNAKRMPCTVTKG